MRFMVKINVPKITIRIGGPFATYLSWVQIYLILSVSKFLGEDHSGQN